MIRTLAFWVAMLATGTAVLWAVRDAAHEAHMALAYLLLVLGGSARGGRVVGLSLALLGFLAFNFFLLPPYYTLTVEDPLDWWVLVSFLATGLVAAQLFHRAQRALALAQARAREVERLSALGAESLSVPRAADALAAITRVIRQELPVAQAEVWMVDGDGPGMVPVAGAPDTPSPAPDPTVLTEVVRSGRRQELRLGKETSAPEGRDGSGQERPPTSLLVPLSVHDRPLGVLHLWDPAGIPLDRAWSVFVETLTYYAALAVERVRLSLQAEHVDALREADRMKDAVLASVSHDLRTPLTTIRALAAELRGAGDARSVVIEEEADRLNRMVTDLLDLSQIRSGTLPLEVEINAAEDLIGATLQRVQGIPGADRITVTLPPDGSVPLGRFDFVHALRALGNLVENALRHSPGGDAVEISVASEGGELVTRVADRGPGVPQSERERIFQAFQHSGVREGGGTGLGLAIARTVAEAQGGTVRYIPREGGGSVFELRLPGADLGGLP